MNKAKVLVIDDDENNRIICKANLSQLGVTVIEANDGQEGFDAAMTELPDLILLDIMMPVLDGYQTLEKLKDTLETRDIPVIMLTAKTDSMATEISKTLLAGADDYIRKPYQLPELIARVRNLARKHLLEKERAVDLREAARFQRKYLTNSEHTGSILKNAKLNAAFFNKPATDVSGDFWFYKRMPKGKAGLFVADTCGHGVLAALMSIQVLSIVDNCPAPNRHPSECLMSVNTDIYGLLSPEHSFVAAMYLVFDQNKLVLSNAGQPAPLLLRGTEVTELKLSGLPLGMSSELDFDEIEHDFIKGDRLIIYSDGLPESTNVQGEPFGAERIITHLQKNSSLSVRDMKNSLISELQRFANCEFDDDITLIIIEREHDLDEFLNRNNINGIKEEKNADS